MSVHIEVILDQKKHVLLYYIANMDMCVLLL